jgi:hypothetical protein
MDLITEQSLLTMNGNALVKRKAVYDDFSNIHNDGWRKFNFVKSALDKRQPPITPTATSLGIKIKIFVIKVYKSFTCACTDICACRCGQQISEF